jgi:hypothetical protein
MTAENSSFFRKLQSADLMDPTDISTLVADAGAEWYQNDAAAASLEESKKSVLAKYILEYMDQGVPGKAGAAPKSMSFAQAEQRALADPRYEEHVELMVQTRKNANLSRVRYDMGKMFLELQRSANATRRQEMAMNGETRRNNQS